MAFVLPRLREHRQAAWMSQVDLSQKTGLSRETISKLENGSPARVSTVRRLAKALDVQPGDLVDQTTRLALRAIS